MLILDGISWCTQSLIVMAVLSICIPAISGHDEITPIKNYQQVHGKDIGKDKLKKMEQVRSDVYNGCGFTKTCLKVCAAALDGCPACINDHDCRAVVTIEHRKGTYDVKMLRKLTANLEYIALGISDDRIMGGDAIFACVTDGSKTNHFAAHSVIGSKNLEYGNEEGEEFNGIPQDTFSKPRHTIIEGLYLCEFLLKPQFTMKELDIDLNNQKYFLFGASGEASNFFKLSGHAKSDNGRTVSSEAFLFKDVLADPDYDEGYDGATTKYPTSFSYYVLVAVVSFIMRALLN